MMEKGGGADCFASYEYLYILVLFTKLCLQIV